MKKQSLAVLPPQRQRITKLFGPPGTGKTTTLLSMLKRAIGAGTPVERIAYISHTRAASDEARERAATLLSMEYGSRKFAWFKTIHACCFAMLQYSKSDVIDHRDIKRFCDTSGYRLSLKGEIDTALEDFEENDDVLRHALDVSIHKQITPREALAFMGIDTADRLGGFLTQYEAFKTSIGKWDFGDMLAQYKGDPVEGIDIAFIDEAQDLSRRQWEIAFKLFAKAREIVVAGDDDQSIYAFMGAEEYAFLDLKADEEVVLDYSYRVPELIGRRAERIISRVAKRKPKVVRWKADRGELRYFGGDAGDIPFMSFLEAGKSVMVLTPHVKQAHAVRGVLEERGITSSFKGQSLTTRPEALNVLTYFQLKQDNAVSPVAAAKLSQALGADKRDVDALRALARDPKARITRSELPGINFEPEDWTDMLGPAKSKMLRRLRTIINKNGLGVIGLDPKIDITTYHGSKGREADIVVLVTDCYRSFHEDCQENRPSMRRLCYVGLTRAKERVIIVEPKTSRYLSPLME